MEFDTGTGKKWGKQIKLDSGVDAQAHADARIPQEDALQRQRERVDAYLLMIKGGDPDLETYYFNTLAEIQKYVFRALFNVMRDEEIAPEKAVVCGNVAGTGLSYLNKHNSAAISGFIDHPDWNVPTVNAAASNISAVGVNIVQLDHGEDALPLDDF